MFPSMWLSSGCPAYLVSAGFGSKVSTWLTPPLMKSEITAVARGAKCGALGANGLPGTASSHGPGDLRDPRQPRPLGRQQSLVFE